MTLVELGINLPGDSNWQVFWFGSVSPMRTGQSNWGIHTYFRPLQAHDPGRQQHILRIQVSLAHMHLLPLGRCIAGSSALLLGIQPLTGRTRRETHLVDLSPENTFLDSRSALARIGPAGVLQSEAEYEGMFIRVRATARTPEVLIPCATLFQYFWGTSSRVANLVMTGQLEQPHRFICNLEKSGMGEDGVYTLILREKMKDSDARYLATVLAEPFALDAGCQIGRSLRLQAQTKGPQEPYRLEVLPPFARPLNISGFYTQGRSQSGDTVLYLTHIVSSDLQPAWNALDYFRDNDATQGTDDDGGPKKPIDRPPLPSQGHPAPQKLIDVEEVTANNHSEKAELPLLPGYEARFPEMAKRRATKLEKESTAYKRAERARHVRASDSPFSAIDGSFRSECDVVSAELTGSEKDEIGAGLDGESVASLIQVVHARLKDFAKDFATFPKAGLYEGQKASIRITFLDPYFAARRSSQQLFFTVPRKVGGREHAWLYKDPISRRRRLGICVEVVVTLDGAELEPRYVIDFEPRQPRRKTDSQSKHEVRNGFLVLWFDENISAAGRNLALQKTISAIAMKGNPRLRSKPSTNVSTRSFRHDGLTSMILLSKILGATDQCTDQSQDEGGGDLEPAPLSA